MYKVTWVLHILAVFSQETKLYNSIFFLEYYNVYNYNYYNNNYTVSPTTIYDTVHVPCNYMNA